MLVMQDADMSLDPQKSSRAGQRPIYNPVLLHEMRDKRIREAHKSDILAEATVKQTSYYKQDRSDVRPIPNVVLH